MGGGRASRRINKLFNDVVRDRFGAVTTDRTAAEQKLLHVGLRRRSSSPKEIHLPIAYQFGGVPRAAPVPLGPERSACLRRPVPSVVRPPKRFRRPARFRCFAVAAEQIGVATHVGQRWQPARTDSHSDRAAAEGTPMAIIDDDADIHARSLNILAQYRTRLVRILRQEQSRFVTRLCSTLEKSIPALAMTKPSRCAITSTSRR